MARRTFFSFHFEEDNWRAGQVRNCWVTKPDREAAGFWDTAQWESVKRYDDATIKRWIRNQMENTTVTVVLIGAETASRQYVQYEIDHSIERGNGLLGIRIHGLQNQWRQTSYPGTDPFYARGMSDVPVYDWQIHGGYQNIGFWIEQAFQVAQQRKLKSPIPGFRY